jgi:RHS repeat-associated protein
LNSDGSNPTIEYGYDDNGSLTSKTEGAASTTYTYNLQNRLEMADDGTTVVSYEYDTHGIRTQKDVDGAATDYLIDPYNPTGYAQVFVESDGVADTAYIIGSDIIGKATDSADPEYLLYDGHGSVRQLTDPCGLVLDNYNYDGYGNALNFTPADGLYYTGEMFDSHLDFYYNRARYYNPAVGRFNRLDPFAGSPQDPQSLHKYLYAHCNPINNLDPSGRYNIAEMVTVSAIMGMVCAAYMGLVTAVYGGSVQDVIETQRRWFYIGFFSTALVYGGAWLIRAILVALYGASAGFGNLQHAKDYGIMSYRLLEKYTKGTDLYRHHIIPGRFDTLLEVDYNDMLSVAVNGVEHKIFTDAWQNHIPYATGTFNATKDQIWEVAQIIYVNYPALLKAAEVQILASKVG